MASGDTLLILTAAAFIKPSSGGAVWGSRNQQPHWSCDDTTDEVVYSIPLVMPEHYADGGVTLEIENRAASATSGNFINKAAFSREAGQDADSDGFAAENVSSATATNGTSGVPTTATVTFTDGADMDSVKAGDPFRLMVGRDADNASDTMSGDLEIVSVHIKET